MAIEQSPKGLPENAGSSYEEIHKYISDGFARAIQGNKTPNRPGICVVGDSLDFVSCEGLGTPKLVVTTMTPEQPGEDDVLHTTQLLLDLDRKVVMYSSVTFDGYFKKEVDKETKERSTKRAYNLLNKSGIRDDLEGTSLAAYVAIDKLNHMPHTNSHHRFGIGHPRPKKT